jgi:hypothetical protein
MFAWLAKRDIAKPTIDFLLGQDFETIWGLSFRWCGREAPPNAQGEIPNDVKETAYRIIRGFYKGKLNLRTPDGYKAQREPFIFVLKDLNPWRNVLWRCLSQAKFDVAYVRHHTLDLSELKGLVRIGTPPLLKMSQDLEKLQDAVTKIASGWSKPKVHIYNSDDREAERREWEEIGRHQKHPSGSRACPQPA